MGFPRTLMVMAPILMAVGCGTAMAQPAKQRESGLVGPWFGEADFERFKNSEVVRTLDLDYPGGGAHGNEWSARWAGFLVAPVTGQVRFQVNTLKETRLEIDGDTVVHVAPGQNESSGTVELETGRAYPITLTYAHEGGSNSYVRVHWSWQGRDPEIIPAQNFYHTLEQEQAVQYVASSATRAAIDRPDRSAFKTVQAQHVIVYHKPRRFAGWPANNGIWMWGNEILVGFREGVYIDKTAEGDGHSLEGNGEATLAARSLDGGATWRIEKPENFLEQDAPEQPNPKNLDFTQPGFGIACDGQEWRITGDRGHTWHGPYRLPDAGQGLSARTDYIVNGTKDGLFFLSANDKRPSGRVTDRAFCTRAEDGGQTFTFLSRITPPDDEARSVMPSTVRCGEGHLVTALRQRFDAQRNSPDDSNNWIGVYESKNGGKTWAFLSKAAVTDRGGHNGNPPAMVRLQDGRLVLTYGYRSFPFGIRAKVSTDNGKTWGEEIHLRDDGRSWDLGYCRSVVRHDGKIVTIYYYTTHENPENHIAATIWMPPDPITEVRCQSATPLNGILNDQA